jgi:hypothetical protein
MRKLVEELVDLVTVRTVTYIEPLDMQNRHIPSSELPRPLYPT